MPSIAHVLFSLILLFSALSSALAEIFVVNPSAKSACAAGKPCTVQWLDNGVTPTLSSVGTCNIGLYHGKQQLVQALDPVNVASSTSFTFEPQANAGPNSADYYIAFISTSYKVNGSAYVGFSPNFSLTGMSGSFESPVASLTTAHSAPTSSPTAVSNDSIPVITFDHTITVSISTAPAATKTATPSITTSRISTAASASASAQSSTGSAILSTASATTSGATTRGASALLLIFLAPLIFFF